MAFFGALRALGRTSGGAAGPARAVLAPPLTVGSGGWFSARCLVSGAGAVRAPVITSTRTAGHGTLGRLGQAIRTVDVPSVQGVALARRHVRTLSAVAGLSESLADDGGHSDPVRKERKFAVVQIHGKQYKVTEGDHVLTARLPIKVGTVITLDKVLLVGSTEWTAIGTPLVSGKVARVTADVFDHHRGAKLQVFKKIRRKGYTRRIGHRTNYTTLRITGIDCTVPTPH